MDGQAVTDRDKVRDLTLAAAVWGLPLVMMHQYLDAAYRNGVPFNRFFMSSEVATSRSKAIGPNIDTLNGRAWLDLEGGPQVIGVPDTGDRYYSVQLQDMYMNAFAYIGRRTTGTGEGAYAITPPGFTGSLPDGVTAIPAPTTKVLAFVRMLVRGRADLPVAQALNRRFTLGPLAGFPGAQVSAVMQDGALDAFQPAYRQGEKNLLPHEAIAGSGAGFYAALDGLVRDFPPLPADRPHLARFQPLGIGGGVQGAVPEATLAEAVPEAIAQVQRALQARPVNGWMRRDNVKAFIEDPVQRAANNIYGPNTQVAEESVFFNKRVGPDGAPLTGANRYRLRFAAGETPPVDAFWSLTLYDKAYTLFDNPLDRYGITWPSDELRYGADGTLEIRVQADPPDDPAHNWLPSPRDGFQLILRTYQPRAPLLDGSYVPPPLELAA